MVVRVSESAERRENRRHLFGPNRATEPHEAELKSGRCLMALPGRSQIATWCERRSKLIWSSGMDKKCPISGIDAIAGRGIFQR